MFLINLVKKERYWILAAGVIVLAPRNGGTFLEVLEGGKYGFGFNNIEEGREKLKKIIELLENGKLVASRFTDRVLFFSGEKFKERLNKILTENL